MVKNNATEAVEIEMEYLLQELEWLHGWRKKAVTFLREKEIYTEFLVCRPRNELRSKLMAWIGWAVVWASFGLVAGYAWRMAQGF